MRLPCKFILSIEANISLVHLIQNLVASGDSVHDETIGSPDTIMCLVPRMLVILDPNAVVPPKTSFTIRDDAFIGCDNVIHPHTHMLKITIGP